MMMGAPRESEKREKCKKLFDCVQMMNSNYTITTYKSLARVPPHPTTTADNTRQGSFTSHAYSSGF